MWIVYFIFMFKLKIIHVSIIIIFANHNHTSNYIIPDVHAIANIILYFCFDLNTFEQLIET